MKKDRIEKISETIYTLYIITYTCVYRCLDIIDIFGENICIMSILIFIYSLKFFKIVNITYWRNTISSKPYIEYTQFFGFSIFYHNIIPK